MAKKTATSSPIRVQKAGGAIFFRITAFEIDGETYPGFEVFHRDYTTAKKMFWAAWDQIAPGVTLRPRVSL